MLRESKQSHAREYFSPPAAQRWGSEARICFWRPLRARTRRCECSPRQNWLNWWLAANFLAPLSLSLAIASAIDKMEVNQLDQKPLSQNQPRTRRHEKAIFPHKLWKMVNDPRLDLAIKWTEDGQSFILNERIFKDLCLGKENQFFYTRHVKSFVRQLHLYGFKKINKNQFAHDSFKRGEPHLLSQIKRAYRSPPTPVAQMNPLKQQQTDEPIDEAYINYTYNNDSILDIYSDIYPNYSENNNIM